MFKYLLTILCCFIVCIIVTLALRTDPCTHDSTLDPGPDFLMAADFDEVMQAQIRAHKATLDAMKIVKSELERLDEFTKLNHGMILKTADKMILVLKVNGLE